MNTDKKVKGEILESANFQHLVCHLILVDSEDISDPQVESGRILAVKIEFYLPDKSNL